MVENYYCDFFLIIEKVSKEYYRWIFFNKTNTLLFSQIRNHLLQLDAFTPLFYRIRKLGLTEVTTNFLLYDVQLEEDHKVHWNIEYDYFDAHK